MHNKELAKQYHESSERQQKKISQTNRELVALPWYWRFYFLSQGHFVKHPRLWLGGLALVAIGLGLFGIVTDANIPYALLMFALGVVLGAIIVWSTRSD